LLTVQHVDNALDAKGAAARDLTGRPFSHIADNGGGAGHRVPPQERDGAMPILGRNKRDKASLIGHVERIQAEQLAGRGHLRAHRGRLFVKGDREDSGSASGPGMVAIEAGLFITGSIGLPIAKLRAFACQAELTQVKF
jgi:hypothetical protein